MKDKLVQMLVQLFSLVTDAFTEAGGFGWRFVTVFLTKMLKSELWVAAGAMLGALLAPRLGIPEDKLLALWSTLGGIAVAYIAQRGYAKPKELAVNASPS